MKSTLKFELLIADTSDRIKADASAWAAAERYAKELVAKKRVKTYIVELDQGSPVKRAYGIGDFKSGWQYNFNIIKED